MKSDAGAAVGEDVAIIDFGTWSKANPSILALKLDHLGDFIIGLPSLRRLREAFPGARIRLVTGSWNRDHPAIAGLADELVTYDFFPREASGWDGRPHEAIEHFRAVTTGHYDIAIDLRVNEDTRALLAEVDASIRAGIGSSLRHKFLDVALPPEHAERMAARPEDSPVRFIGADNFRSAMPRRQRFYHETDFRRVKGHLIYGPDITLPLGGFRVSFNLQLGGWKLALRKCSVTLDVARNGTEIVALQRLRFAGRMSVPHEGVPLTFVNEDAAARYEFRIFIEGQPIRTWLRFAGVRLDHLEAVPVARFRPAMLHIGEQLSLLVQLLADRTRNLYPLPPSHPPSPAREEGKAADFTIAIAPFSNSDLRNWPAEHYVKLIGLLFDRFDCTILLLGSPQQAEALDRLAENVEKPKKIRNLAGETSWPELPALLRQADLVICNNSGIAHIAAASGARTLAIYSASHPPAEWGPRGPRSHALMAVVACSPCGYDRLFECTYGHRCMQGLLPATVFEHAARLLLTQSDIPAAST
jgi:ADP-heptose:LPS heptosyltransferase